MDKKTVRMLQLLDKQVQSCERCILYKNGRAKPYWTEKARFAILGEAPGRDEVVNNTPFIGKAGEKFWSAMESFGLYREDFLIINSVNCRPVKDGKNGKPTDEQMDVCRMWFRKYLKVLKPSKILTLGSYAYFTLTGNRSIMKDINGVLDYNEEFGTQVVYSVHPAYVIYNPEEGQKMLCESIKCFKGV